MPRSARKHCESNIYHVTMRGVAQRIIFVDNQDRRVFLRYMKDAKVEYEVEIYAWCLMTNHFHLLVRADLQRVSKFIGKLASKYATYFNRRHERVGHLFQDRFDSRGIDTESYLLAAIRYIHRNPIGPGLSLTCDYPWSSYREYLGKSNIADTDFFMNIFDSLDEFIAFHSVSNSPEQDIAVRTRQSRMCGSFEELVTQAKLLCGPEILGQTQLSNKMLRDTALRKLKLAGFSIRQIESLTSLSYGVIQRACAGT